MSTWRILDAIRQLKRRGLKLRLPSKIDVMEVKRLRGHGLSYSEIARIIGTPKKGAA